MADASTLFEDVVDSATSSQLEEEQEFCFVSSLSNEETTQETTVEAEGIAQMGGDSASDATGAAAPIELFTVENMNSKSAGAQIVEFLNGLPLGRAVRHRALTCNRVIKALKSRDLLPVAVFGAASSYGQLSQSRRQSLEEILGRIDRSRDLLNFQAVVEAILGANRKSLDILPAAPTEVGSVAVNRYALLCHAMIDPRLHPLWVEYNTSVPAGDRHNRLTEGANMHENDVLDRLLAAIRNTVAVDVANLLKNDYPAVFNSIHPELGTIEDRVTLKTLFTQAKNNFDVLWLRLDKSGRSESGETLDAAATQLCKYGRRAVNASHFYQYLLWKGQDLLYLSNRLPDGVGVECGFDGELEGYALVSNRVTAQPRLTPTSEVTTSSSTVGQASVLSKKDQKRIDMQRELGKAIAESMAASSLSPGAARRKRRKDEAAIDLNEAKKKLVDVEIEAREKEMEAKEKQIALQRREADVNMIRSAMNDPSFEHLSAEEREGLRARYLQLLLEAVEK